MANTLKGYNDITANSLIKFLSGSQADLNTLISVGNAEEGVFYLTNDTHKLYVGRTSKTVKRTDTGHTNEYKVIPEQVSRGVTVVENMEQLPSFPADAPTDAIEEGELYYIANKNVLAALHKKSSGSGYEWVQINPSTGVKTVKTTASSDGTDKTIQVSLEPQSGSTVSGKFHVIQGSNVTLTTSNTNSNSEGAVTIAAKDTTYTVNAATNNNKGQFTLTDNQSTPTTQTVDFEGSGTVKVTSTPAATGTNAKITVAGPTFSNIQAANAAEGFNITLNGSTGGGTNDLQVGTGSTNGTKLNPTIRYGSGTTTDAKFQNGVATLSVYSKAQTDTAISNAIDNALQVADAMTFRGVVTSANTAGDETSLMALVTANGAHNGDVYKVGSNSGTTKITIGGVIADVGDLIVIHGNDEANGVVSYTANDLTSLESICQLIPSGDEPEVMASVQANNNGTGDTPANFRIYDGKNNADATILTTKFQSGTDGNILLKGTTSGKTLTITADHPVKNRSDATNGDKTNISLTTNTSATESTVDTLYDANNPNQTYNLFVLNGPNALKTDSYGHVTGLQGTSITFKHNRLKTITSSYGSADSSQANATLTMVDTIGTSKAGSIKLKSDSLSLGAVTTGNDQHIKVDLKWGTF